MTPMPEESKLTFEAFQASGEDCADLGEPTSDEMLAGIGGRLYLGCLFIEDSRTWAEDLRPNSGRWYTIIGNCDYSSDDLAEIETILWEWAGAEGYTVAEIEAGR